MTVTVNAAGLACPEPVILTRKALMKNSIVDVIVDNETSLENVKRLGEKEGCSVQAEEQNDGTWTIHLKKEGAAENSEPEAIASAHAEGPTVIVISEDRMGRGDDELGYVLIRGFIHTLLEIDRQPDTMIFYNTGVKLTASDSEVIDDLRALENLGVEILVCGTCTNYFEIGEKVGAGSISNMYDIATKMTEAARLVMP